MAEKKTSRVGTDNWGIGYQCAVIPTVGDPIAVPQATLVWLPPTADEATRFDAAAFTSEVVAGRDYPTKPLEAALHALYANNYNGDETVNTWRSAEFVSGAPTNPWSEQERALKSGSVVTHGLYAEQLLRC